MRPIGFALLALLTLAGPTARAAEDPGDVRPPQAAPPLDRRAWATEVRQLRARARTEIDALSKVAREAVPGPAKAEAQRALETAKSAWNRRMLDAQLARVRAAGLTAEARRIEERIAGLDAVTAGRAPAAPAGEDQ